MQKVICLIAPTASGKTNLAYELYDTGKYYLISVDSALIYREMNIGTAKPTETELIHYPHALINIINPDQSYSVAQFVQDAKEHIQIAHQLNKIPVLVGGTMMYYMAIFEGIAQIPATLPETREKVNQMLASQGVTALYDYLQEIDPVIAQRLTKHDSQRIGRAIEVFLQTQKPLSEWQMMPKQALIDNPQQKWAIYCILPERNWLHQRIAQRLTMMWQEGLVKEVIHLRKKYSLTADMPSMRCVGYRQVWNYLEKIDQVNILSKTTDSLLTIPQLKVNNSEISLYRQTMENEALYATRQLAKRQYTWLRKLITVPKLNHQHELKQFTTIVQAKQQLLI